MFCALAIIAAVSAKALLAEEMTIKGQVSQEGIVADDGQTYAVADDEKGTALLKLVDKKVEVTGKVEEREGKKVITVTDYKVTE
jgi:hypothetical protein